MTPTTDCASAPPDRPEAGARDFLLPVADGRGGTIRVPIRVLSGARSAGQAVALARFWSGVLSRAE